MWVSWQFYHWAEKGLQSTQGRQLLQAQQHGPSPPVLTQKTSGVIYQINCEGTSKDSGCRSTYIGETGRILKVTFTEHRQPSTRTSEVSHHLHLQRRQKHQVSLDNVRILDHEADGDRRGIKTFVHVHAPPRPEQGWRPPSAPPHLGQHSPFLLWPAVTEWWVTVPPSLNHTIVIKTKRFGRKLWVSILSYILDREQSENSLQICFTYPDQSPSL